jgi:hypothetical protein
MRVLGSILAAAVSLAAFTAPARACSNPYFQAAAGFYSQVDDETGASAVVRLEFVGRTCVLVASLVDPASGLQVYAGRSYFTLPELLGCTYATVTKAADPYAVLRAPVASLGVASLFEAGTQCSIQINCAPGTSLPYTCTSRRSGNLVRLRD